MKQEETKQNKKEMMIVCIYINKVIACLCVCVCESEEKPE